MFLYQTAKCIACFGDEQEIYSIFCSCFVHQENPYMLELAYHAYCRLALALSVLSSPKLSEHFAAVFNKIARDAKHKLSINKPD